MYAYTQSTFNFGAPMGGTLPPLYNTPPRDPNGLGRVSGEQLRKELHSKNYREHQEAMVTHNRIPETREAMLRTAGGAGLPQIDGTMNNPEY